MRSIKHGTNAIGTTSKNDVTTTPIPPRVGCSESELQAFRTHMQRLARLARDLNRKDHKKCSD